MNKHGQSTIEYALIAVLVLLGVVVMGPYVLRSINAHFKLWDDSVQDSFTENITQAPVGDVPPINTNCTCSMSNPICGSAACQGNEAEYDEHCTPQGCNGAEQTFSCNYDATCCTTYYATSNCGSTPIGQAPPSGSCNVGQRVWSTKCADQTIECVPDCTCNAQCYGSVSATNAVACTGSPGTQGAVCSGGYISPNQNSPDQFVQNCAGGAAPCQYTCNGANHWVYSQGACVCDSANGYVLQGTNCVLPPPVTFSVCCDSASRIPNRFQYTLADGTTQAFVMGGMQNASSLPTSWQIYLLSDIGFNPPACYSAPTAINNPSCPVETIITATYNGSGWVSSSRGCNGLPYTITNTPGSTNVHGFDCGNRNSQDFNFNCNIIWGVGAVNSACP